MIILGTPQISIDLGIPEWAVWLIVVALYFGYRGVRKLIKVRKAQKHQQFELNDLRQDLNEKTDANYD